MNSPKTNVSAANTKPTDPSIAPMRVSDTPETRITVYSEPATSCARAKIVPISAAIGATLGAWLVAAFSGSQGAAGSYPGWLEALFGLDPATAEAVSTLSRKVVHFVFYGTIGLLHLLALSHMGRREAVGASWVVVVLYAWTDETRQMGTTVRWGSPWDVLLDLTGAAAFTLVWVLRKRSPQR